MFKRIPNRTNWRSGRTRLIAAALICTTGMIIGIGTGSLFAQVGGPNPTTGNEAINGGYCDRFGFCATLANTECTGNGDGCVHIAADQSYNNECTTPAGLPNGCTGIAPTIPCAVIVVGTCYFDNQANQWVCQSDNGNTNYGSYYRCTQ